MKKKVFVNRIITILACVGILFLIGSAGNVDYATEIGECYSLIDSIKLILVGIILLLPAILREVI